MAGSRRRMTLRLAEPCWAHAQHGPMVSKSTQIAVRARAGRMLSPRDAIPTCSQFLSDGKQDLPVFVPGFAEALSEFVKIKRVLALASPSNLVRGPPLQEIRELRRLFAIIE